jgi:hypothetical protein
VLGVVDTSEAGAMNDMHGPIRALKGRWAEEDAARDKREERARQLFLEAEAKQTFATIEQFLVKLTEVLKGAGASVEIDTWQHLDDQKLRRVANILSPNPLQRLCLDFTIQGLAFSTTIRSFDLTADRGAHTGDHRRGRRFSHAILKPSS